MQIRHGNATNANYKEATLRRLQMERKKGLLSQRMSVWTKYFALLVLMGVALAYGPQSLSQSTTSARLSGSVTDSSGALVPHVSVTAQNTGTNLSVTVESDDTGVYAFNSLPPGAYKLTATHTGFAQLVDTGVSLTVGQNATLNLTLKTGGTQDTVTVTAGTELINTTTAEIGQIVDENTVKDLPLNGRDPGTLVFLSAGITNELNSQASTLQATNSFPNESGASAGGQRQGSTWYLLDGVSNMDTYTLLALPFPNPDATQEFRVVSNNFDARNGFAPSAVVSIQTKSGANEFHGGLFEFIRNDYFNAKNPFSGQLDTLKRNQYGAYMGGPIQKDKLFFFGNYQGTRQNYTAATNTTYTPTAAERNGDFSALLNAVDSTGAPAPVILPAPFVNNQIDPSKFSPGAVAMLKFLPIGQNPVTGYSNFSLPMQSTLFNEVTARLDYNINQNQRIFVRSFQNDYNQQGATLPSNILAGILGSNGVYLNEVINHTWTISPTTLNTFAVGWVSYDFHTGTALKDSSGKPICLSEFINVDDPPNACYLEDFYAIAGASSPYLPPEGFQSFSSNPDDTKRRDYSATETFTKAMGRHTFAAGADLFHRHHTERSAFFQSPIIGFNGQYTLATVGGAGSGAGSQVGVPFADYLLGKASQLVQGAGEAGATSQWMFGVYAQDQYKVTPTITATLGLRWDPNTPAVVAGGRGAAYVPGQQSTRFPNAPVGLVFPGDKGISDTLYNGSYTYFEPRIGLAWSINPNTTVRAAFGMFTTPMEDAFYQRVWDVAPFNPMYSVPTSTTEYVPFDNPWTNFAGGPGLTAGKSPFPPFAGPQQNPPSTSTFGGGTGVPATFLPNLKLGVTQSWNASLEQQLTKAMALHVAYVASESYHQATTVDRNPGNSGTPGQVDPNRGLRVNPAFGGIIQVQDGGTASYKSLQAGVEQKFSHGFQFQSNFTWSKTTDVGGSGDPDFESSVSDPYSIQHDKGPSSLNVPFVWVTYGLYHTPKFDRSNFVVKHVLGGWAVSAIYTAESGEPFTINGGNGNNNSGFDEGQDRADLVAGQPFKIRQGGKSHWLNNYFNQAAFTTNELGTPGNSPKFFIQCPPVHSMDASFSKQFTVHERYNVQFRWEMFNALNTPSYGSPDNNPGDSNFGQITGIGPVAPRVIQGALKLTF
jgi:outer membrane receptor protein involved in Fe transport